MIPLLTFAGATIGGAAGFVMGVRVTERDATDELAARNALILACPGAVLGAVIGAAVACTA